MRNESKKYSGYLIKDYCRFMDSVMAQREKEIPRPSGKVIFLRSENFMKNSRTRRKMIFLDSNGNEVRVIHAFAVLESAVGRFLRDHEEFNYKRAMPPAKWNVYSMKWDRVNRFVAFAHQDPLSISSFMNFGPGTTEVAPNVIKFRRSHAIRIIGDWRSDFGAEVYDVYPAVVYQVIFAERKIACVKGGDIEK